ncbi:MAG: PAS domain S-box protein [Verrucomicrobiota bacterium]|nr:PAS domain S-box protein [Verrucomicrobiota bacterium]
MKSKLRAALYSGRIWSAETPCRSSRIGVNNKKRRCILYCTGAILSTNTVLAENAGELGTAVEPLDYTLWWVTPVALLLFGLCGTGLLKFYRLSRRLEREMQARNEAKAALLKSERLYRTLVETQPGYVCVFRTNGELIFVNEAYARYVGLPATQLIGRNFMDWLLPEARLHTREHLATITLEHPTRSIEQSTAACNQDARWICWTDSALTFDEQGNPTEILSVGMDISERKSMEEALRRSEEKYRLLAENSEDIVFTVTLEGKIGYVSPSVERLTGFPVVEIAGQLNPAVSKMGARVITEFLELCKQGIGSPAWDIHTRQFEIAVFRKDGTTLWMDMQLTPIYSDGQLQGLLGAARDISHRQKLDRLFSQQNELLSTIINDVPAHIAWFDEVGQCVGANNSMITFLRAVSLDTLLGKTITELPFPNRVQSIWHDLNEKAPCSVPDIPKELLNVDVGGEQRTLEMVIHPLGFGDGVAQGTLVVLFDVTEERQRQQLLSEALVRAESATHAKSIFIASMSHEIRTPLTTLCGVSRFLSQTQLDGRQQQYVNMLDSSSRHLLSLINDILDFSKLEVGKVQLHPQSCNLREICEESLAFFRTDAAQKGILLTSSISGTMQPVLVDRVRLKQVLTNLLSNAVKFTPAGVVTLGLAQTEAVPGQARIYLWVQDTGIGITKEEQARIFEPFYQVDSAHPHRRTGTGLGLTICQMIIEAMNSTLELFSQPHVGTRFAFTLNLPHAIQSASSEHEAASPSSALTHQSAQMRPLRVLLVEDDDFSRFVIAEMLCSLGALVTVAEDADEALDKATTAPYDIHLIDMMLPGMDGIELAQRLRTVLPADPHPNITLITANTDEPLRARSVTGGLDAIIIKPPSFDQLRSLLHQASPPTAAIEDGSDQLLAARLGAILPDSDFKAAQLVSNILWRQGSAERLLTELVTLFQQDYPTHVSKLSLAAANEAWDDALKYAHRLKSTARTLGAYRLLQACESYEAALEKGFATEYPRRIHDIVVCLDRVASFLSTKY